MIKGYNLLLNSRGPGNHKLQIKRTLSGALIVRRRGTQRKPPGIFMVDQINLGKAWLTYEESDQEIYQAPTQALDRMNYNLNELEHIKEFINSLSKNNSRSNCHG